MENSSNTAICRVKKINKIKQKHQYAIYVIANQVSAKEKQACHTQKY